MPIFEDFRALFKIRDAFFILSVYNQYFNAYGKQLIHDVFGITEQNKADSKELIAPVLISRYSDELKTQYYKNLSISDFTTMVNHCFMVSNEINRFSLIKNYQKLAIIPLMNDYINDMFPDKFRRVYFLSIIATFCSSFLTNLEVTQNLPENESMIKDFSDYFKHTFFSTPCYQFVQFNTLHSIAEKKFHLVENYKLLQCYLNYYVYIISSYEIQQNIHTHRAIISPYNCDMQYPFYVIDRILPLNLSSFMKELLLLIMFNSHKIKYVEMHEHVISLLKISKDSTNYVHAWLYYFFSRVIPK